VSKPHWPDACRHDRPRDRFLGTIEDERDGGPVDVHVYQDNALTAKVPDMHLCLRYGREGHEYVSPGNAIEFVRRWKGAETPSRMYLAAVPLVEAWIAAEGEGTAVAMRSDVALKKDS